MQIGIAMGSRGKQTTNSVSFLDSDVSLRVWEPASYHMLEPIPFIMRMLLLLRGVCAVNGLVVRE